MRTFFLPVRITRTRRCKEGFYVLFNGSRIHFKRKADALDAVDGILSMQRIQVVSVREASQGKKVRLRLNVPTPKV